MIKYKSCEARLLKEKKFCESQEWNFEDLKYKPWSNLTGGTLAGNILAGNILAGNTLAGNILAGNTLAGGTREKEKKFSRKTTKNTMTWC